MKKLLINFSNVLLSREQMKKIKGGYDEDPGNGPFTTCEAKCKSGTPLSRKCSGTYCSATDNTETTDGKVCCDINDCKDCPK